MRSNNGVIMQYFEWYCPNDGSLWNEVAVNVESLSNKGVTAIWLPPCYKGAGGSFDVGYGTYDLFDLGEFDQKGSVRTKYGTKAELLSAIRATQTHGMECYADIVFNHKDGGDNIEYFDAQEVDWNDRNVALSDWYEIAGYTEFIFANRNNAYSSMKWNYECFDALSFNVLTGNSNKLYRIKNKLFSTEVSHEHQNYDYLSANDLDTSYDLVKQELLQWGQWFYDTTHVDGFRIDACKHIRFSFFNEWLTALRVTNDQEFFSVGEYWSNNVNELHQYISETGGIMSLFDVPLHFKFSMASTQGASFNMQTLWDDTLMQQQPTKAVTFVENHDTQPCRSLESTVEPWFKPHAYAFILLRQQGYPCIFYADYYGTEYPNCRQEPPVKLYSHKYLIDIFLFARKAYCYGDQHDYFDHPNTIGWVQTGSAEHPGAMAVVMTNGTDGFKWMNVFRPNVSFRDATNHIQEEVITNEFGWGQFKCPAGNVSVWLQQ